MAQSKSIIFCQVYSGCRGPSTAGSGTIVICWGCNVWHRWAVVYHSRQMYQFVHHSYLHHQSHHHHDRHHHHPRHDQHQHQHLHHKHYYHYLIVLFAGGQSTSQSFIFKDLKCGTMWSGQPDNAINLFIRYHLVILSFLVIFQSWLSSQIKTEP